MPLKLVRRHGSDFWYMRGTVRGFTVDESTKVTERQQAEAIRAKREWEIVNRQLGGSRATATFLEAAVSYLEKEGEARFVKPLVDHFKSTPLAAIGQAEVENCARKLYPNASESTRNRQVYTPVSAIMHHAAKRKLCEKPTFERPAQPRGRIRWLTYEEADKLIAACAPHLKTLVTFLFATGCRLGEALELDWRDVDLQRAHAAFLDTKNGESRGVPLHPRVVAVLANLEDKKGKVFRRPDGKPYEPRNGGGGQIKTGFKAACRRANVEDFSPHDCRHTWATWHYAANRDIAALMRLGGWKTMSMVMRYAHVNASDLAPGIANLWGKDGDKEGTQKTASQLPLVKQAVAND